MLGHKGPCNRDIKKEEEESLEKNSETEEFSVEGFIKAGPNRAFWEPCTGNVCRIVV